MYFEMFLAVTIVLVLVNLFIVLLLVRLSKRVKKQIEANVVSQLSAYDSLIGAKSDELHRIKTDAEQLRSPDREQSRSGNSGRVKLLAADGSTRKTPDYLDGGLADKYDVIKRSFAFDKAAVVREVCGELHGDATARFTEDIDKKLDVDTVYGILGADDERQADCLRAILDDREQRFLDAYIKERGSFDILDFKQYVSASRQRYSDTIYVRTGDSADDFGTIAPNIQTVYDPDICEGLVVVCGNTLYDYSLQKKEINS